MEAVSENTENVTLFWELFNEVLVKVSGGTVTVFNPIGWCTDMAGLNLSEIRKVFGESVVKRILRIFFSQNWDTDYFQSFPGLQITKIPHPQLGLSFQS